MKLIILLLTSFTALGQLGTPTYNPFNNGGFQNNGFQRPNYGFQNNGFQRPNYGFQNNGFQNGYQRPNNGFNNGFQNNGFQNNGYGFNNGFQNNGFNNFQQQNNNFQQQGNNLTNKPQLFTRRYHLNNGYLFGRPTLYFDAKSGKMQPWVRKNLR